MYVLALDSTAVSASVALSDDERLLGEIIIENGNTHSETLLPMVEELLARFSLSAKEIDLFACTAGPGSFTGVRIGAATVKGIAFGTDTPCVGVSTLEALAYNLYGFGAGLPDGAIVSPVMNARRSQVYNALFRVRGGLPERITEDRAIAISDLEDELLALRAPVYLVGDGYAITEKGFSHVTPCLTPTRLRTLSAYAVTQLARHALSEGRALTDKTLVPVYLRPCQAERERNERLSRGNAE